jgi:hypothetical protein
MQNYVRLLNALFDQAHGAADRQLEVDRAAAIGPAALERPIPLSSRDPTVIAARRANEELLARLIEAHAAGGQAPPPQGVLFDNPQNVPGAAPGELRVAEGFRGFGRLVNGQPIVSTLTEWQPMGLARIRNNEKFKQVKVGTVWCVQWMDRIIAQCPTQSRAHTLAKWGNKWLRTMTNGSTFYNVSMGISLADFFQSAASSLGGLPPAVIINGQ